MWVSIPPWRKHLESSGNYPGNSSGNSSFAGQRDTAEERFVKSQLQTQALSPLTHLSLSDPDGFFPTQHILQFCEPENIVYAEIQKA